MRTRTVPGGRLACRVALALPAGMLLYLVASGRLVAYFRSFGGAFGPGAPQPSQAEFMYHWRTALMWVAACAPAMVLSWWLGREHVAARRHGYAGWVGLRELWRLAWSDEDDPREEARRAAEFARPPKDDPRTALLWGAGVALLVPAFFAGSLPLMRTGPALAWLGGAGLIMGTIVYCRRRAAAYLVEEPVRLDPFREWRLLNAGRYEAAGRVFVRLQLVLTPLLMAWWLVGGSMALRAR